MNTQHLHQILTARGISPKRAVVCGSSAIAAQYKDFREPHDIDLVVPLWRFILLAFRRDWVLVWPSHYTSIFEIRLVSGECEAFFCWRLGDTYVPYRQMRAECSYDGQVYIAPLSFVKRYKRSLRRDKDVQDLAFLRIHHV